MHRLTRSALVIAGAVAVATCADAPTGTHSTPPGGLRARVAVAARLSAGAASAASQLPAFGIQVDNVHLVLRRSTGVVALDTTIVVAPGDTLSLALPVAVTQVDERFTVLIELRQGTTVLYSGEHVVTAVLDGATASPPPVVIDVDYTGPGATATRIRITPRDSVFLTTARPQFAIVGTDAAGATVPAVPVLWSTSDPAMATVDPATGVLTPGNRRGTVTLRARSLSGLTDTLPITLRSPVASLRIASGDGQTGPAGRALPLPLVVEALAADGLPAAGETVRFTATHGAARPEVVVTGADGRAATTLFLAPTLSPHVFTATLGTLAPVTSTQHAVAGAPATLLPGILDTLRGIAGRPLPVPLSVLVRDSVGIPVPGVVVAWTATAGTLGGTTSTTDSTGTARVAYTFATAAGDATVGAAVGALGTSFAMRSTPGTPARLAIVSGDAQRAPPGTALAPFVVRLSDEFDNPIRAATVAWTHVSGSGTLASLSSVTDSTGTTSNGYTTGTRSGTDEVKATAAAVSARFTAVTEAGAPARVTKIAGDSQVVVAGTAVPQLRKARVTDVGGNGTPATVDITVTGPGIATPTVARVATDTAGYVVVPAALLERPRAAGVYATSLQVVASAAEPVSFTLTVVPAPASALRLLSGATSATSGSALSPQPVVQLVDSVGNPAPQGGVVVTASVGSGATLSGSTTATTVADGSASFADLTITAQSGTVALTFSAASIASTAVEVAVTAPPPTEPPPAEVGPPSATGSSVAAGATTLTVGDTTRITVSVRDSASRPVTIATAANFAASASTGALGTFTCAQGVCSALYTAPTAAGSVSITATIGGTPISGSPVALTIVAAAPSASTSTIAVGSHALLVRGTTQVTVTVKDAAGNAVRTATPDDVDVTVSAGTLGTPGCVEGTCTATFTAPDTAATATISAAIGGAPIAGSPVTITVSAQPSAVAGVLVSPEGDTLTSIGDAVQLTATALDSTESPTAGSFTWVSRNPAAVTVNANGTATAVANGSAYVVALEQGGAADSALVVVAQRVATVAVTPGATAVYLGASARFTAAAVDARGNPIGSPTFTWASTSAGVASVDSTGRVVGLSLGTSQVRATAGGVTGVASLTVRTAITRIAVGADSGGVPVADTSAMTALGQVRSLIAVAYDTLDAPMTGITFAWSSTNSSVVRIEDVGATSASMRSAANGSAAIRAIAQGVTGSAPVRVQQVLTAIQLAPVAVTIAPSGSVGLVARGVDANGFYIPGGSFSFTSSNEAAATVGATTGEVTGVAEGTANVTATSGAINSNAASITVAPSNQVPPAINFGRDTLSVGRGSTTSIPIYLSRPFDSPVTVALAVETPFAHFDPVSVTFLSGQTTRNVTLVGDSAGTSRVFATDASDTGFAPDTAVLAVQATLRLTSSGYGMNATDSRQTQVLLSDPSPAGGTYVDLAFGAPDVASASPNPVFIPAGQLAADVVLTGLSTVTAQTSTTVTPSAIGVNGTASTVTVYPAKLLLSTTSTRLGAGQYTADMYVHINTNNETPIPLTLTSSDSTIAAVTRNVTIPGGSYYAYFTVRGEAPGTATITVSSPGWTSPPTSLSVRVTNPRVTLCCGNTLTTTTPTQVATVYATDSLGSGHLRTSSLVVRLSSSNPAVLRVIDTTVTIAAGAYYNNSGRYIPGGSTGTAWLIADAGSSHGKDSVQFTVNGPKLQLSSTLMRLGVGQQAISEVYAQTPHTVAAALPLTITSSDSGIVAFPTQATIPAGSYYAYIGARAKAPGQVSLIVRDRDSTYMPDTLTYVATTPRLVMSGGGTVSNFAPPSTITVYSADSTGSTHPRIDSLQVALASTDTSVVKVDATAWIAPGQYYTQSAKATFAGVGTASVIVTAPGHTADTVTYTVTMPKLSLNRSTYMIGAGQVAPSDNYVQTPNTRTSSLTVTYTHSNPDVVGLDSATTTIPAGSYYSYFPVRGLTPGEATVVVEAAGYTPDTVVVRVSRPKFTTGSLPTGRTTTSPDFTTYVYTADSLGTAHAPADTVTVHVTSSDTTVIRPLQAYVRVPTGTYYVPSVIDIVGPGSASLTFTDSAGVYLPVTSNTMTVTGPALQMSHTSSQLTLGMGQTSGTYGAYVRIPNPIADTIVVSLASTDTNVVRVPAAVIIPAGDTYAYFPVDARDTVGTIQVRSSAIGYSPSAMNVRVTVPKLVISTSTWTYTTSASPSVTVYAADANGTTHFVREPLAVRLTSSAPGVASLDTTITIPAGEYYNSSARWNPESVGTAVLTAADPRSTSAAYIPAETTVQVNMPTVSVSTVSSLGIGQYYESAHAYTPDYQAAPLTVTLGHLGTPRTATPSTLVIPAGSYYAYFRITGTAAGVDSLVSSASSPQHVSDTAYVTVGEGRIDPVGGWPTALTVGDSVQLTLYARAPDQGVFKVAAATSWSLSPNDKLEFRSGNALITSVTIPADSDRVSFWVKAIAAGSARAVITSSNYTTYENTFTVNPAP